MLRMLPLTLCLALRLGLAGQAWAHDVEPPAPGPAPVATTSPHPGYCVTTPTSRHCQRSAGFEVHSFWDRGAPGALGTPPYAYGYGTGWPLSHVFLDVGPRHERR